MASQQGLILMMLWDLVGKAKANAHWHDDDVRDKGLQMFQDGNSNRQIAAELAKIIRAK
jgi:hypothetical protein